MHTQPSYFTVPEIAERLRISVSAAYALVESGKLAHHRVGARNGAIRVSETDLTDFLANCRREPANRRPTPPPVRQRLRLKDLKR